MVKEQFLYLCDCKKCKECTYPICKHTDDLNHAKNKEERVYKEYPPINNVVQFCEFDPSSEYVTL